MKANQYMQLIHDGKFQEAEYIRQSTIPDKLIKFVWLDGNDSDEKKFLSLKKDEIWFSHKRFFNDPYEFKGMLIDQQKMKDAGYQQDIIDEYQALFDMDDCAITCLSANKVDYLPMWAYYTNNHKGFCVEYNVVKKDCVHEVLYEPERIKIASLILQYKDEVKKAIISGKRTVKLEALEIILMQNFFIKAESWRHEREYRIVYPIGNKNGENISVSNLGMRTSKIIAGINCSDEHIEKLNQISNNLGLGDVYKSRLHKDTYTIEVYR